jgi:DNA-binding NarL/FixJ family response regulator
MMRVLLGSPLTSREEEILFAIADGRSNAEIAGELFLSIETVKCHVQHLLIRLGARNRTHAVALAYHRGLLVPAARP